MKTHLLSLIFLFLISSTAKSQYVFRKTLNFSNSYYSIPLSDSSFVFCGTIESSGSHSDVLLAKLNASGDTLWSRVLGDTLDEIASCVQQTSDGGFILTGVTTSAGMGYADKYYLLKTDANGHILWSKAYGGPTYDYALFVDETSDGGFVMIGYTGTVLSPDSLYVLKTDMSGTLLWSKTYATGSVYPGFKDAAPTMDGGYLLTGGTYQGSFLLKINGAGDTLWAKTYDSLLFNAVMEIPDGHIILTGAKKVYSTTDVDMVVMKANATGIPVWANTYPFPGGESAYDICAGHGDNFLITGEIQSETSLLNLNSDGSVVWTRNFISDPIPEMVSRGVGIHTCPDGGYLINAVREYVILSEPPKWIIKTDSLGNTGCDSNLVLMTNPISPTWNNVSFVAFTGGGLIPSNLSINTTGFEWASEDCSGMVGIKETKEAEKTNIIYPNPNNGEFTVQLPENMKCRILVTDALGKIVFEKENTEGNRVQINLTAQFKGIYYISVFAEQSKFVTLVSVE